MVKKLLFSNFYSYVNKTEVSFEIGKKPSLSKYDIVLDDERRLNKVVAIIGANGSGKSTLINILTGLIKRYKGNVAYCGFKNQGDFLHKVGVQFQENK